MKGAIHVTLHMAISIDGFIAFPDGDSDWVSPLDEKLFTQRCREAGSLILGRQTYDQYKGKIYPVENADNIVISRTQHSDDKNVFFVRSPLEAITKVKSLGHRKVLLSGGGKTSASFLDENLIDEIFLSVHPVVLGKGLKLFDGAQFKTGFCLSDTSDLGEGLVQLHYTCPT
jgi:dihydrofolate reductase